MSGIVFGGIAPHGFSIIGEIAGKDYESFKAIRSGMEEFGTRFRRHQVDTVVILTPHGLHLKGYNSIYLTDTCQGTLSQYGLTVRSGFDCDKVLAQAIYEQAQKERLPLIGCTFGAMSREKSNIPMDWAILIPMWFCAPEGQSKPNIVVITPSRETPYDELISLGKVIATASEQSGKRVALIASADQGHCHQASGPYGYAPESRIIDETIIDIIKRDALFELKAIPQELIEKGKPDSIWQMLILYGALQVRPLKGHFITYQVPTYFGMLAATYE